MRIAFVAYSFGEYCIRQVNEMAHRADVLLLMPDEVFESAGMAIDPAVKCVAFKQPRLRQPLKQIACVRSMLKAIRQFQPDVMHFHHGHLWFNLGLPFLRRIPLVFTIHDAQHHPGDAASRKTPQRILNFGYRRADRVIAHSQFVRDSIVNSLRIPSHRIDLVPHVALGSPETLPQGNDDAASPSVLFFGRIWEYKGLEYLIRAQPAINAKIPDARIVIGGRGEDFDRYRSMMADPDRFVVHNDWISDELRTRLFQQTNVVVLPYVEASQSGVIPVAYSFAKPVIATHTGGLPEMVEDGRTGLLVPPRDAEALAEAVVKLLGDQRLCREMGAAGKEKLERECSAPVVVEKTLDVYRRAIDSHNRVGQRRIAGNEPAVATQRTNPTASASS